MKFLSFSIQAISNWITILYHHCRVYLCIKKYLSHICPSPKVYLEVLNSSKTLPINTKSRLYKILRILWRGKKPTTLVIFILFAFFSYKKPGVNYFLMPYFLSHHKELWQIWTVTNMFVIKELSNVPICMVCEHLSYFMLFILW